MMINFNGKIVCEEDFNINYNNRFFLYGDGFFETIRVFNGEPIFWNDHYFRIIGSACMLRIPIPSYLNSKYLYNDIIKLLKENKLSNKSCRLRIIFFRDSGGYYMPKNETFSYVMSTELLEKDIYTNNKEGYKVDLFNQYKLGTSELNNLKSTNRLINILSSIYTEENMLNDSIIINEKNNIVEFSSGNLFLVLNNQIITPPLDSGCINGIIRKKILNFNSFMGLSILEKNIKTSDLYNADELFSTNVISGVKIITYLKEKKYSKKYSSLLNDKLNLLFS